MRLKMIQAFLIVLASAALAGAQTKISGSAQCGKPEAQHMIEVGDNPGHLFGISKVKCTWTKPIELGGSKAKEGESTGFDDISGNSSKGHGIHVSTLASGDKFYVKYEGSATLKDGAPQAAQGTWRFKGGTGSVKGIKGKGTYKGTAGADGSVTYDVEGEYELPAGKATTK